MRAGGGADVRSADPASAGWLGGLALSKALALTGKSRDRKFLNEDGTREGKGLGKITAT